MNEFLILAVFVMIVFIVPPVLLLRFGYRGSSVAYVACSALILNACWPPLLRMRLAGPVVRDVMAKQLLPGESVVDVTTEFKRHFVGKSTTRDAVEASMRDDHNFKCRDYHGMLNCSRHWGGLPCANGVFMSFSFDASGALIRANGRVTDACM